MNTLAKKTNKREATTALNTKKSTASRSNVNTTTNVLDDVLELHHTLGNANVQKIFHTTGIQAKLNVSQPNDPFEQEAQKVADEIVTMPDSKVQEKSPISVQRKRATSSGSSELSSKTESQINSLSGRGESLSSQTRAFFEPRFGHDFSNVRIHTDSSSSDLAQSINAKAFTKGNHIVFNNGQYTPNTLEGKKLLGHELTHVVQQNSANSVVYRDTAGKFSQEEPKVDKGKKSIDGPSLKDRADLIYKIYQTAYTDLDSHGKKWINASEKYGLSYKNAYDLHTKYLSDQEKYDALMRELYFSVLSVVSQGALSSLSTLATHGKDFSRLKEVSINTIEDITQAGLDKTLGFVGKSSPSKPVSTDPLKFYLQMKVRLSDHIQEQSAILNKYVQWSKDLNRDVITETNPKSYEFLHSVDTIAFDKKVDSWKQDILLFKDPETIDEVGFSKELEIGMWAQWAKVTRIYNVKRVRCSARMGTCREMTERVVNDPGSIVEKRLDALGISKEAGVYWGNWTFDSDVKKLVQWGKKWKPKRTFPY